MMPDAIRRQEQMLAANRGQNWRDSRLHVPPTVIIESVSPGHEQHDRRLKRSWYAEAGAPNYWLLNAYEQSLECFVLKAREYHLDQSGRGNEEVSPGQFPGLLIPLAQVWD